MRVIAIETSTSVASVAIVNDNKVEVELFLNYKLQHSTVLFPMVQNALSMLSIDMKSIDSVVVSGGPGSFTGLRIGASTAKGLVQGTDKGFLGISCLDTLAYQNIGFSGVVCPILDALRDNVYTGLYKGDESEVNMILDYDALHIDELLEKFNSVDEDILFCGDGVHLHRDKISDLLGDKAKFALSMNNDPRASSLGLLGIRRLESGHSDDIFTYGPLYLRASQAEREYEKKHGKE
ncbi:tRNA (adenosine(37)-N6)-threonylcarbamoyltransferase complex dimerization subunit type 1 TsaB [Clostridium sp.]|uniref:tRNA (adenosine(37)-N6)-threonylcarbamoyltransferase complex dimerization subunit type 1 TsaB n=2 Tax=Clostridium sp. TaxID=1506 RepID=UPI002FC7C8B4